MADGTSDIKAWATTARVSNAMSIFKPGDSILFRRGDTWTNVVITIGTTGISGNNITIGAYGVGSKPILSGPVNRAPIIVRDANRGFWTIVDLDIRSTGTSNGINFSLAIYFAYWLSDLGPVPGWIIQNCSFNSCILVSGPGTIIRGNVFDGSGNINNRGGAISLRGPNAKDIIVENNTISNYTDRGIWAYNGAPSPVIRNNTIYDIAGGDDNAGMGINIDGFAFAVPDAKVYNNHVYDCDGIGITLENGFGAEVYNNKIVNCGWGGLDIWWYKEHFGQPSNVSIHHNIIHNGEYGIIINAANTATIANNTFVKDDASTIKSYAFFVTLNPTYVSDITFTNNIITGTWTHPVKVPNAKRIWSKFDYNIILKATDVLTIGLISLSLKQVHAMGYMTHGFSADPRFVNAASDWHLQTGSPAINSGLSMNFTHDFDGNTIDDMPDIGAFEYTTSPPVTAVPFYVNAVIQNAAPAVLEVNYNMTLANITPPASAFSVMVDNSARPVSSVAISGSKVLLTLSRPVSYGDSVTITFTVPSFNPLQSATGEIAATITDQTVTNNVLEVNSSPTGEIVIYPNPANTYINILKDGNYSESQILRIFDLNGKLRFESSLDIVADNVNIPLKLNSGLYLLKINSGSMLIHTQTLVIL